MQRPRAHQVERSRPQAAGKRKRLFRGLRRTGKDGSHAQLIEAQSYRGRGARGEPKRLIVLDAKTSSNASIFYQTCLDYSIQVLASFHALWPAIYIGPPYSFYLIFNSYSLLAIRS